MCAVYHVEAIYSYNIHGIREIDSGNPSCGTVAMGTHELL